MEQPITNFDIHPLVFPAGKDAVINVKPLFEHAFSKPDDKIRVDYSPMLYPVKGYEVLPGLKELRFTLNYQVANW